MCIFIWFPVFTIIVQIVLEKGLFASVKGHLCLTKVHLDYHEGQVEVESPIIESCFWYFWFKSTKKVFSKRGFLTKRPIPGCFIFLKQEMVLLRKIFEGDGITSRNIWRGWYYFAKYLKGMVLLCKWRVILVFYCLVFYCIILVCSVWFYFVFFIVFVTEVFESPSAENSP